MGKVRFTKTDNDANGNGMYECDCPMFTACNHAGDYYPAADYEALQRKLAALVKVSEAEIGRASWRERV